MALVMTRGRQGGGVRGCPTPPPHTVELCEGGAEGWEGGEGTGRGEGLGLQVRLARPGKSELERREFVHSRTERKKR